MTDPTPTPTSWLEKIIWFSLTHKLIVFIGLVALIGWGLMVSPFQWETGLPRSPLAVDAIPDIGENQQIVFTQWPGRSPQDVEDQITYPLTVALLGVPEVKTVRGFSMFGFSSIYVVFNEKADFYWTRTRILEKLSTLSPDLLPPDVRPTLGPDATALGQIFWYTLEGHDTEGNVTGGWGLDELRSIQDFQVKQAFMAADGVSEVASIGGFVKEYQIDVDPDALSHYGIALTAVMKAVKSSNRDIGAKTMEINRAEYIIRSIGTIGALKDIENTVIAMVDNTPITVRQVATVTEGPALRRGLLDNAGTEAVGGVVVSRFGANPMHVIDEVKAKIAEIELGLPTKILADGTESHLKIVPFYDRSVLIHETLNTLNKALVEEILITIIVVLLMILNIRSSLLIAGMLPLSVLMVFIVMKQAGVDANIVSLSGIAIAIGTIVDMGIVMTENILTKLGEASETDNRMVVIYKASAEVGSAVLTAVMTTVISFIPVFTMTGAAGKLFKPLAFTKTAAMLSSIVIALVILPPVAYLFFGKKWPLPNPVRRLWTWITPHSHKLYPFQNERWISNRGGSIFLYVTRTIWKGIRSRFYFGMGISFILVGLMGILLADNWRPLGEASALTLNILMVVVLIGTVLGTLAFFQKIYPRLLGWCLENKKKFLAMPVLILIFGVLIWSHMDKEFMPALDEGSFLYMPTMMTHAGLEEAQSVLQKQDIALAAIPEVERVVGKLGRVDSPLDPAPISMIETIITYKPEYSRAENGERVRNWRPHIHSPDDIWKEIQKAAQVPGTTSAPKLQPIEARVIMLQSGIRAPMAIKIKGPDLKTIEAFGIALESVLKTVPAVNHDAVFADRVVGKPYYEIHPNRESLGQHGISVDQVQEAIMMGIGGMTLTQTTEGRERYDVRIRYQRERRDSLEALHALRIDSPKGYSIPLAELAEITYMRGPQVIKSEDTFLSTYVIFDKQADVSEMAAITETQTVIKAKLANGDLVVPKGVSFEFTGNYQNLLKSEKTLQLVLPLAMALIFVVLYLQFGSLSLTGLVFLGILLAWSGGFMMLWLYGQAWIGEIPFIGSFLKNIFQLHTINLSTAVWVGFLALFGIASDDGVMMGTFLKAKFAEEKPNSIQEIRQATIDAGVRRIRPCLMTTATTILALLPVLTSTGRGADIMIPMAIPSFGGMFVVVMTLLTVPVMYAWIQERAFTRQ